MLTIDASVLVAAAIPDELDHAEAGKVLTAAMLSRLDIHEPALALVEVVAAVARRTGNAELARAAGRRLLHLPGLILHTMDGDAAVRAADLAAELRLRAADTIYAATSLAHGTTLVTLDAEMAARASGAVDVCLPAEWLRRRGS